MDVRHLEEPDFAVWLGFGLIAEQYGEPAAAAKMYGRVKRQNSSTRAPLTVWPNGMRPDLLKVQMRRQRQRAVAPLWCRSLVTVRPTCYSSLTKSGIARFDQDH